MFISRRTRRKTQNKIKVFYLRPGTPGAQSAGGAFVVSWKASRRTK
jgi:hypothetical protein